MRPSAAVTCTPPMPWCLVQVWMALKRKKQKGVRHDGTRWSSDANGLVSFKTVGSNQWKRFRMKENEADPEAAIADCCDACFAKDSHAASPAAPPANSTSSVPPTTPCFETTTPPSSDPPPKVGHAHASHRCHRPPAGTKFTEAAAVHPTTTLHHLFLHIV